MRKASKWFHVGRAADGEVYVECTIDVDGEKRTLSLTGVIGPKRNGDARGSCGQISLYSITPAEGWTAADIRKLRRIWKDWHLNSMRPGCEHQRAEKWDERPIDPSKPLNAYGKHSIGQRSETWNMLTWVTRVEHPQGLLSFPCPTCGYKYGDAWLHEPLPESVVEWLGKRPTVDAPAGWAA